jgi:hypothetical protein
VPDLVLGVLFTAMTLVWTVVFVLLLRKHPRAPAFPRWLVLAMAVVSALQALTRLS